MEVASFRTWKEGALLPKPRRMRGGPSSKADQSIMGYGAPTAAKRMQCVLYEIKEIVNLDFDLG